MGRMAFLHTIPTVQLRSGLVSRSDVSFIVHITLPDHPDPVPTLIDSGATSNFIDAQLATRIPTTQQSLAQPIALCLFDGKPATSGFIHEYIKTTISFPDSSSQSLSLLITQLHPSAPIVLGLPWLKTTNPTIDWASMSLQFQSGTGSTLPTMTTAMSCITTTQDVQSTLPSVFDTIPELHTSSGSHPSIVPGSSATISPPSGILSKPNSSQSQSPIIWLPTESTCHQSLTPAKTTMPSMPTTPTMPTMPAMLPDSLPFPNGFATDIRKRDIPRISLVGAAAFKKLIDAGEDIYSFHFTPSPPMPKSENLFAVAHRPAPTSLLHGEVLPTDEAELLAKVVPNEYLDFVDVFSRQEAKAVPPHRSYDHKIEIEDNKPLPHGPIYPMSGVELETLHKFLDDMLGKGFIRPSISPGGAPVLFAKKKDGTLRLPRS